MADNSIGARRCWADKLTRVCQNHIGESSSVQDKSPSNRTLLGPGPTKPGSSGKVTNSPESTVAVRPKRGFAPEGALRRWSDEDAYSELLALSGKAEPPAVEDAHKFIRDVSREREYSRKREALEAAFKEKLIDGEILAVGIATDSDRQEIMHPSIWELLEIDYGMCGDAVGANRKYEKLEFFEPSAIPLNVRSIPDWLAEEIAASGQNAFRHDPTYRHVSLNGIVFTLGPIHSKVVKLLHEAALENDPWQNGKTILERAGSTQSKMVDVFKSRKDWLTFIESDGRGMYRLRIDSPQDREE